MAFVQCSPETASPNAYKIDIVVVSAIGADPDITWTTRREHQPYRWIRRFHEDEVPFARVLLYDHLEPSERLVEVKPVTHRDHNQSTVEHANIENELAKFGIDEWTNRFLKALFQARNTASLRERPLLFIAHSTGGIIVKKALISRKSESNVPDLASICIGCVFFATPHHGSHIISGPEFATAIKNKLHLKFEMSEKLRSQFDLQNPDLETLNYQFSAASLGLRIWNYIETRDSKLGVLTSDDEGEDATEVSFVVVDYPSAVMTTQDVLIEEEEVIKLNTTHVGTARFADSTEKRMEFCQDLKTYIKSTSAQDRACHHKLTSCIMDEVIVDVHQFYQQDVSADQAVMKVWSEHPSLREFLESGPTECLKARLHPSKDSSNGTPKPHITVRHPSVPSASIPALVVQPHIDMPSITVDHVPGNQSTGQRMDTEHDILEAPTVMVPKNIHTRRPPLTVRASDPEHLTVSALQPAAGASSRDPSSPDRIYSPDRLYEPRPQRARTFQPPTQSTDRFCWVHVPYNHHGWVAPILTAIAQDKGNTNLHRKLLSDQVWKAHHNRSRHASSHARFVRSACKLLQPRSPMNHNEELISPSSSISDVQLALYLPYIHWDTFQRLQERAEVIRKRGSHAHPRPIDKIIAHGNSMECKLIWQYLNSKWPLHIRRTLDQYGYPALRNTSVRDADQVIYKQTRNPQIPETKPDKGSMHNISAILKAARESGPRHSKVKTMNDGSARVLMVDQLWLFVVDNETVVTFVTPKEKEDDDNDSCQGDIRTNIYKDVNGDYARECDDCFDFAALAVFHAVKALLDHTDDPNLQVFRIFEEYISELTELQTKSFKEFRDNHRYRDPNDLDVSRLPQYVDNRDDLNSLLELRDIEDELTTIQKLFSEQHKTIKDMLKYYEEVRTIYGRGVHGMAILHEVDHTLDNYQESVTGMLKSAEVAQKAYEKLLDMKQKQANIVEAHLAREQTEVAADQSRSVMIFTIFTIIFLPLSFFASIFGMNISEWSGVSTNVSMYDAFVYMGCISLAVIIVALLVAFNRFSRRILRRLWKVLAKPVTDLMNKIPSRRVHGLTTYWHYRDLERGLRTDPPAETHDYSGRRSSVMSGMMSESNIRLFEK